MSAPARGWRAGAATGPSGAAGDPPGPSLAVARATGPAAPGRIPALRTRPRRAPARPLGALPTPS
jgi:hypothetical protein